MPSLSSQLCLQSLGWCLLTSLGRWGFLDTSAKSYGFFSHEDEHILNMACELEGFTELLQILHSLLFRNS